MLVALKKAKKEKPKLKLNVSKPVEEPEEGEGKDQPPPPDSKSPPVDLPPSVPVVTDENGRSATLPPLPLPDLNEDDEDDESEAPVRKRLRPEQKPIFKIAVLIIGILLLGAVGFGGYMVYNLFFGIPDAPPPLTRPTAAATPRPAVAAEPAQSDGPFSIAGKLIEKAQDAAAAHDEIAADVESVLDEGENQTNAGVAIKSADNTPQVVIDAAPILEVPETVEPSQAFRDWVSAAVISGVREGDQPRAFINSLLVKKGDTLYRRTLIVGRALRPIFPTCYAAARRMASIRSGVRSCRSPSAPMPRLAKRCATLVVTSLDRS